MLPASPPLTGLLCPRTRTPHACSTRPHSTPCIRWPPRPRRGRKEASRQPPRPPDARHLCVFFATRPPAHPQPNQPPAIPAADRSARAPLCSGDRRDIHPTPPSPPRVIATAPHGALTAAPMRRRCPDGEGGPPEAAAPPMRPRSGERGPLLPIVARPRRCRGRGTRADVAVLKRAGSCVISCPAQARLMVSHEGDTAHAPSHERALARGHLVSANRKGRRPFE